MMALWIFSPMAKGERRGCRRSSNRLRTATLSFARHDANHALIRAGPFVPSAIGGRSMVTNDRYFPEGFIGTEQAAVLLAKLLHEEHWRDEDFVAGEQSMWDGFG